MNLFSRSRAERYALTALVASVGVAIYLFTVMGAAAAAPVLLLILVQAASVYRTVQANNMVEKIRCVARDAASGKMDSRVLSIHGSGNIQKLMHDVNHLLDQMEAFSKEAGAALEYASRGRYFRKILLHGMNGDFSTYARVVNDGLDAMGQKTKDFVDGAGSIGANIKGVVTGVSSAAQELDASSQSLAALAEQTSSLSETVRAAANSASGNVESVAAATEEFTQSIREIHDQVKHSARKANSAVKSATHASEVIDTLHGATGRIDEVVSLINDIAEQTNMLALNATIEAARAGEAGKGFVVVAGEVKNLSNQTSRATQEIAGQVRAMKTATQSAVDAIHEINQAIKDIDASTSDIAATVEQQSAVVGEISNNSRYAVSEVSTVASTIHQVADGASESSSAVTQIRSAAGELAMQSQALSDDVGGFVDSVVASN